MKRILLIASILFLTINLVTAQSLDNKFWETDGLVNTVVKRNNKLLIGGKFNYVGPNTGSAVMFNNQTNSILNSELKIMGQVNAIVKDAMGLIYIGGEFESMGRKNLLVMNPDGSLNSMNISVGGPVKALHITQNILLIGGSFETVNSTSRMNCAAVNTLNGQLLPLSPNPDGEVRAFAIAGAEIIIGGSFSTVLNQTRNGLASISALSGTLQSLNNSINGTVNSLDFDNGLLYVGGNFSSIDTFTRNNFGAINLISNTVTSLNPDINGPVNVIEFNSSSIYVGGSFSQIGFEYRNNIAAFDKTIGVATTFNPAPSGEVNAMVLFNSALYLGGDFNTIGSSAVSYFASIDLSGSLLTSPKFNNKISSIFVANDTIIAGGEFSSFGGVERSNFASFDFNTGIVEAFAPNVNDEVKSIELYGNHIAIGGNFTSINTISRSGFALIDTLNGDPISIVSDVSGQVNKIVIAGNSAYLGGLFSLVNSTERGNLAKVSLIDGSLDSWNNSTDDEVTNLKAFGSYLYVTGKFSEINDTLRRGVARFNLTNEGSLDIWNPSVNNDVYDLIEDKSEVYLAGSFSQVGENFISYIAAVDTANALPIQGFNPTTNFAIGSIDFDGDVIYAGSLSFGGMIAFHSTNSNSINFNFSGDFSSVKQVKFIDNYLFVSGNYKLNNGNLRNNISGIQMLVSSPDQAASNIQFSNVSPIGMTLHFNKGNGSKHLVIGRQGSAVDSAPVDGVDYSSSSEFGMGNSIGSGNFVLSNSSDTFVEISSLNIGTAYYFAVYEVNGIGSFIKYQSSNPATASQSTIEGYNPPTVSASSIQSKEIKTNSMKISWTKGNGSKRIVVAKEASAVNAIPTDSTSLFPSEIFANGYDLGNENYVVYNEAGDSLELFNLKSGTTYHFAVFEYNGISAFARVKTDNPATASFTTLVPASEPTEISSNISFSEIGTTSVKLTWTLGNGSGRIIIASQDAEILNGPVDGEVYYSDGNFNGISYSFSNTEKILYIGSGSNCTVNGLNPGSTYYFGIIEYNGASFSINYLESAKASASVKMKVPGNPPVNPSNSLSFPKVSSDSLYLKWISGIGEGRVVFIKKGGLPTAKPVSGVSYRADVNYGSGDSLSDGSFAIYDGNLDVAFVAKLEANTVYGVVVFDYNIGDFGKTYQVDSFAFGLKSTLPLSGLSKKILENQIKIYPIPSINELNIEFVKALKGKIEVKIFDLQGKMLLETIQNSNVNSNQIIQLDLSKFENGNYILNISNGKEFLSKPLIISK